MSQACAATPGEPPDETTSEETQDPDGELRKMIHANVAARAAVAWFLLDSSGRTMRNTVLAAPPAIVHFGMNVVAQQSVADNATVKITAIEEESLFGELVGLGTMDVSSNIMCFPTQHPQVVDQTLEVVGTVAGHHFKVRCLSVVGDAWGQPGTDAATTARAAYVAMATKYVQDWMLVR